MKDIIESYIKRPVLYDIIISVIVGITLFSLLDNHLINNPQKDFVRTLLSDLSTIAFTSTGFILTILTVLITFKSNSKRKEKITDYDSALSLFFNTPLYTKSTSILKNCIKILLLVALLAFLLKAFSFSLELKLLFSIVMCPLILITMSLLRCVIILSKIHSLQNIESNVDNPD